MHKLNTLLCRLVRGKTLAALGGGYLYLRQNLDASRAPAHARLR
jgi:hypothetical protein